MTEFAYTSLEAIRKRLLDLSSRNALLNFRHTKTKSIQIVGKSPNWIANSLQAGNRIFFQGLKEPTEQELRQHNFASKNVALGETTLKKPSPEEWASRMGIDISLELPNTLETDDIQDKDHSFQILLWQPNLDARLKNIRANTESALQETGANILYLALGFLEWTESDSSDKKRLAPLYTFPVTLELDKYGTTKKYSIYLRDDDVLSNTTLYEKLSHDFGLLLPLIEPEQTPEQYFSLIEQTILKEKPNWKIKRRASLVLLNFTKQAMYRDLDPKNWPADNPLEKNTIIKRLFSTSEPQSNTDIISYPEEYLIDTIENIHVKFPLIDNADSSQHSALIDAVNGENLVIEGPPGSGKSQTITNLIAACINAGKTVLFVAEKMAALNVVKNRLDKAGLGDFCLELHSNKTNKLGILHSLDQKMKKQQVYRKPEQIEADINRYENYKLQLDKYAELINLEWKKSGLTIHNILSTAARYRNELNISPEQVSLKIPNNQELDATWHIELIDNGKILNDVFTQVLHQTPDGSIHSHYWYGINRHDLMDYEEKELVTALHKWNNALKEANIVYQDFYNSFQLPQIDNLNENTLDYLRVVFGNLPSITGDEFLEAIPDICVNPNNLSALIQECQEHLESFDKLNNIFGENIFDNKEGIQRIHKAIDYLYSININDSATLKELVGFKELFVDLKNTLFTIENELSYIHQNVPSDIAFMFSTNVHNLKELQIMMSLIHQLPEHLLSHRNKLFDNSELDILLPKIKEVLSILIPLHKRLSDIFKLNDIPDVFELQDNLNILSSASIFTKFTSKYKTAKNNIAALSRITNPDIKELLEFLPDLISYKQKNDEMDRIYRDFSILGNWYRGIDTPIEQLSKLREWYKNIREEYGFTFGPRVRIGEVLLSMDSNLTRELFKFYKKSLEQAVQKFLSGIQRIQIIFTLPHADDDHFASGKSILVKLYENIQNYFTPLNNIITGLDSIIIDNECTISNIAEAVQALQELEDKKEQLVRKISKINPALISNPNLLNNREYVSALAKTSHIAQHISQNEFLSSLFTTDKNISIGKYRKLCEFSVVFWQCLENITHAKAEFFRVGNIEESVWRGSYSDNFLDLTKRNQTALDHPTWLQNWSKYLQVRYKLSAEGLRNIITLLECGKLEPVNLSKAIKLATYHHLANDILQDMPQIKEFNSVEHNALINRFREYDEKLMSLQREQIAFNASRKEVPVGISSSVASKRSEYALIQHEYRKKKRHIPLRELLDRASNSVLALKPCFMMSPMSVAQYLKPGNFSFDIVIMDEASQILPEDAIGAITRGTQVVIVGDPKQLPPTNFFQKINTSDEEEESEDTSTLEETESVLDAMMSFFKTRRLRWHYRSRHESLIAFSNKYFYNSDLVIFPSPVQKSEEFGIRFKKVQGCFNDSRNSVEAQEIVQEASRILLEHPEESVGIVAMNSQQRDEIENQLELLMQSSPKLQEIIKEAEKTDPVFVKNLENVQGDERDVILISMTYGPSQIGGRVYQRFGPINSNNGWRRLNVLFTRAKKRMHIFSSMNSSDILLSESSNRSLRAFRDFLIYCETGSLQQTVITGKAPDSDFEIAVMQELEKRGYQCEPQLGVNGFFLDIAVRNPNRPGEFLMGIECDGATYHSAKSARDRDRLRQDILEGLGWNIRRIWSTDWFKNPEAALSSIIKELEILKEKYPKIEKESSFFDKIENVESSNNDQCNNVIQNDTLSSANIISENLAGEAKDELMKHLQLLAKRIIVEKPDTPDNKRLLRPEMIKVLKQELPASREEFQAWIPEYLRKNIAAEEGIYLDDVFKIICDYS